MKLMRHTKHTIVMLLAVMAVLFSASSSAISSTGLSKVEVINKTLDEKLRVDHISVWTGQECKGARPKITKLSNTSYLSRFVCKDELKRIKFKVTIKTNQGAIMKAAQSIDLARITANPRDTLSTIKKYLLTKGGEIIQVPYSLANVVHPDSSRDLVFKAVDGSEQVTFKHVSGEGYSVFELDSA